MRPVNLLPAPRVERREADVAARVRTTKAIALASGALLVLILAAAVLAFQQGRSDVSDRRAVLGGLQSEVARSQAAALRLWMMAAMAAKSSRSGSAFPHARPTAETGA